MVACSLCLESKHPDEPRRIEHAFVLQCDECQKATRQVLADSDLPKDLQNQLYLYLFDTHAAARAIHETYHAARPPETENDIDSDHDGRED